VLAAPVLALSVMDSVSDEVCRGAAAWGSRQDSAWWAGNGPSFLHLFFRSKEVLTMASIIDIEVKKI